MTIAPCAVTNSLLGFRPFSNILSRKKTPSLAADTAPADASIERLIRIVGDLSQEVRRLRTAVDHLRQECECALRGVIRNETHRPVMHITSMPKDPCAADFGERVNRLNPDDLPPEGEPPQSPQTPNRQGELW